MWLERRGERQEGQLRRQFFLGRCVGRDLRTAAM